ncbi:hypothetical protein NQK81_27795 [Amycolatopsis roodepoortensis]|uniref:hypothetical protein n=1 Tax=Amycolatopsis roodepoortensis TaxID=700274 RepID=UPI00214C0080|nr:hypothetical protein [Amycolatopsis roodepoortensis]UUV28580.1 hypothetical protein NQK81_27795 [Amycolatopsis roodepoortensis]
MTDTTIDTVGELIAALDHYDPAAPLRLATQPAYPLENLLARVVCAPDGADRPVVWLGASDQVGYVAAPVADALGWS